MFSYGSSSSISLATVTPSLVTVGEPNFLSITTLRPLGPSVAMTARASLLTPLRSDWRAASSNTSCFAAIVLFPFFKLFYPLKNSGLFDDGDDVVGVEDLVFLVVQLDFR